MEREYSKSKHHELNDQALNGTGALVQALMMQVVPDAASAAHIACCGSLGAIIPAAVMMANTTDGKHRVGNQQFEVINTEILTFVSLVVTNMWLEYDQATGLSSGWGPWIFAKALTDWEKIYPDKKAEVYLDPNLVASAREERAKGPEEAFWKQARPGYFLPNNGSIN